MRWFYLIARSVVWAFFSLAFSIQYEGRENIPQGRGGYILAGNHTSYLDPVVLVFPVRPWVRFLGKAALFGARHCTDRPGKRRPFGH